MNTVIDQILLYLNILICLYFSLTGIYFAIFSVASVFYREKARSIVEVGKYKISILIPAYREDSVIVNTAASAARHKSNYASLDIVVIADSLENSTLEQLHELRVTMMPVSFTKSTKAKSLNYALAKLSPDTDFIVLLDADNIMEDGFVDKMIKRLTSGYRIVQGHRTAKNSNSVFAELDGLSEEINNSIFRKGHRALGFSAALIGSGIICEFGLFKELMQNINATGGFDKELELKILAKKLKIGYASDALVYDEKIQGADAFVNQRRRWLSAQFLFFRKNFLNAVKQLFFHGNPDFAEKTIQHLLPPRIISVGIAFLMSIIHLPIYLFTGSHRWILLSEFWFINLFLIIFSMLLAIPASMLNVKLFRSIISLPAGLFFMLKALFKLKGADRNFIHTKHNIN